MAGDVEERKNRLDCKAETGSDAGPNPVLIA